MGKQGTSVQQPRGALTCLVLRLGESQQNPRHRRFQPGRISREGGFDFVNRWDALATRAPRHVEDRGLPGLPKGPLIRRPRTPHWAISECPPPAVSASTENAIFFP